MPGTNPFTQHADVTRVFPDLFENLDASLVASLRTSFANNILEGWIPTRDEVAAEIAAMQPQAAS